MKFYYFRLFYVSIIILFIILNGCSGSGNYGEEKDEYENYHKDKSKATGSISELEMEKKRTQIVETAREEQKNEMYSSSNDSTYLYWINNPVYGKFSKCNIFVMNVLYKAGCKCPYENVTTYDLMDTLRFNEILPVINFSEGEKLLKGDLIIWNGHVIIFESYVYEENTEFVVAWWGGSKQPNNGIDIINDVAHGRYPLKAGYIVRRPVRVK